MKNIFVATPLSAFSKDDFEQLKQTVLDIKFYSQQNIISDILSIKGFQQFESNIEATKNDIDNILKSDIFLMIYPKEIITSALFELGIAYQSNKKIYIFTPNKEILPFMLKSLDYIKDNIYIYEYSSFEELKQIAIEKLK